MRGADGWWLYDVHADTVQALREVTPEQLYNAERAGFACSQLAARTLMQALLGGLCNLAQRIGRDEGRVAAVAVESGGAPDVTG